MVFPVHPRTHARLVASGWQTRFEAIPDLHLTEPLGYLESLSMMLSARLVVTDSGGLQEETSALGVPCLTLRDTTERPVTLSEGTNILIANNWPLFRACVTRLVAGETLRPPSAIPYWDGKAGLRIMAAIAES